MVQIWAGGLLNVEFGGECREDGGLRDQMVRASDWFCQGRSLSCMLALGDGTFRRRSPGQAVCAKGNRAEENRGLARSSVAAFLLTTNRIGIHNLFAQGVCVAQAHYH